MPVNMVLDKRQNHVRPTQDPSSHDHNFGIVGMDQCNGISGPYLQATLPYLESHHIAMISGVEEQTEIQLLLSGERAGCKRRMLPNDGRKSPTGGFGFSTSYISACTTPPAEIDGQVAAKTRRLRMRSAQQFALNHRGSPNACAQCDHYHIVYVSSTSGELLPKKREACVILYTERYTQSLSAPCGKIQIFRVFILLQSGEDAARSNIDDARKTDGKTGARSQRLACFIQKLLQGLHDKRQDRSNTLRALRFE